MSCPEEPDLYRLLELELAAAPRPKETVVTKKKSFVLQVFDSLFLSNKDKAKKATKGKDGGQEDSQVGMNAISSMETADHPGAGSSIACAMKGTCVCFSFAKV